MQWWISFSTIVIVGVFLAAIIDYPQLPLCGLFLVFVSGKLMAGPDGAVMATVCGAYILLFLRKTYRFQTYRLRLIFRRYFAKPTRLLGDRFFLSPVVRPLTVLAGALPSNRAKFFGFAEDALLLKRSVQDIEFIHRMLRDYFALRDLQPNLHHKDLGRRLEAIRGLGFQGDAGIDTLAAYVHEDMPEVREAAIWALGRIASPTVLAPLEAGIRDPVADARSLTLENVGNLSEEDRLPFFETTIDDPEPLVRRSAVSNIHGIALGDRIRLMATRLKDPDILSRTRFPWTQNWLNRSVQGGPEHDR